MTIKADTAARGASELASDIQLLLAGQSALVALEALGLVMAVCAVASTQDANHCDRLIKRWALDVRRGAKGGWREIVTQLASSTGQIGNG